MSHITVIGGMTSAGKTALSNVKTLCVAMGSMKLGKKEHLDELVTALNTQSDRFHQMKRQGAFSKQISQKLTDTAEQMAANFVPGGNGAGDHAGHDTPAHVAAGGDKQPAAHQQQ